MKANRSHLNATVAAKRDKVAEDSPHSNTPSRESRQQRTAPSSGVRLASAAFEPLLSWWEAQDSLSDDEDIVALFEF